MNAPPLALQAKGLSARLGAAQVLHGVDVSLAAGQWISVAGPNGAGKSSLLKCLAGLLAHEGQVLLQGQNMRSMPARARAKAMAWLGQNEGAADDLTAYDLAMLGRLPHQAWLASPSDADHAAVRQALQDTQAWDWRKRPLGQLSGGERQRVLLARALAVQADVLLLDEPLANLDPPHQADWLALMRALVAQGKTVVSVLHELSMALAADQLLLVRAGRIAHHGACDDPATHRALEALFDARITVHSVDGRWIALPH